jgi:tripartite-type tricarboxylate transporter receptor subunit TctC
MVCSLRAKSLVCIVVAVTMLLLVMGCGGKKAEDANQSSNQKWAPKQIEIVMPHKVGSNQDMVTRILGEVWSEKLGIPFVYNNKDGASGMVGYNYFMSLPKDGRALLSTNLASASIMYKEQKPKWKWENELAWMGCFGVDPGTFFVKADSPFKTINDVIEAAKKEKVTVSISYWASPDCLLLLQLMEQTGAKFEIIPYGSGNELVTSVLGGHSQVGFTKVSGVEKAGDELRHLAISMPMNPVPKLTNDAPPLDKALKTKTLVVASYRSINVPKELKEKYPDRYKRIKDAFEQAKDDPRVIESMKKAGVDPDLIVDWDGEQLDEQTKMYWDAFEKFKHIYEKKQ